MSGLQVAKKYWIDIDKDGRGGEAEDNDQEQDEESSGNNVTARDEQKDLVFLTIPSKQKLCIFDISADCLPNTCAYGDIILKDSEGNISTTVKDMLLDEKNRTLYLTDQNLGLVLVDMNLWGSTLESEENRILAAIATTGSAYFGLAIDSDLNLAYVGQFEKGIDIVKLANPEVKLVYKDGDQYKEVEIIAPSGIKDADNPDNYPDEIYLMGLLPGSIARSGSEDEKKVICKFFAQNSEDYYIVPWFDDKVKTYMDDVELFRQSDNIKDPKYNMFLSKPFRVTLDPEESRDIEYTDHTGTQQTSDLRMLPGDFLKAHLSEEFIKEYDIEKPRFKTEDDDCILCGLCVRMCTEQMNANAIGSTGGGQGHNNFQPTLCVHFIVALMGIYPSRH